MFDLDAILARLPEPRDDEPASLRQDILDELTDHLACAFHRELVKSGSEQLAQQRVLARFGDPQQVALKLWWQAMWSRIMSQRILLASSLTMTVMALVAVGMVGWLLQQQQRAAAEQQQAVMVMLDRVTTLLGERRPAETSSAAFRDQVALKLRLVDVAQSDRGLQNLSVHVNPQPMKAGDASYSEITDAEGFADFAYLGIGRYQYQIYLPWGEAVSGKFTVHPGVEQVETLRIPATPPVRSEVTFQSGLPAELRQKDVALVARLELQSRTVDGNVCEPIRQPYTSTPEQIVSMWHAILTADGHCWIAPTRFEPAGSAGGMGGGMGGFGGGGGGFFSLPAESLTTSLGTVAWSQMMTPQGQILQNYSFDTSNLTWSKTGSQLLSSGTYRIIWTNYWEGAVGPDQFGDMLLSDWDPPQVQMETVTVVPDKAQTVTLTPPAAVLQQVQRLMPEVAP